MPGFFSKNIAYLKGVGPQKAEQLKKELGITTYADLIQHYPFRYEDRTKFHKINNIRNLNTYVQIIGVIKRFELVGHKRKQRLVAKFADETGQIDLVWFKGAGWIRDKLKRDVQYIVFGKPTKFASILNIPHPEIEKYVDQTSLSGFLQPIYHTTEYLRKKSLDSKGINRLINSILSESIHQIKETLPDYIITTLRLLSKKEALNHIHFPKSLIQLEKARFRLKFEELFYIQLRLLKLKISRSEKFPGMVFNKSQLLTDFYINHLPFKLTEAQKKVIREVYSDFKAGKQMNRLVQGDVGSGKTIVAFLCMLIAIDCNAQCALMAPTEILANQHYTGLTSLAKPLKVKISKLTGSSKAAERKELHRGLQSGLTNILVGTHALIEDKVKFQNLGLVVIDEQHRFGVTQRAKLWNKGQKNFPHVLVMTATPIPRTLALTLYGDLDISTIDQLPKNRKPIQTNLFRDSQRIRVFSFIENEIKKGRQAYIVYPLIEESEKMDYKDLMDGYESICRRFDDLPISIVHGRMKPESKDYEMQRFIRGETKIMVATTVIEVGVDIPNASVMVIENAEKFGLSQLHQLRGRVGRGVEQSYCILMSGYKLSKEAKIRLDTMTSTNDGFKIAEIDLKLRGAGNLMGTQQSGALDLDIANLSQDGQILYQARNIAVDLLQKDPKLEMTKNSIIKDHIRSLSSDIVNWSRIG